MKITREEANGASKVTHHISDTRTQGCVVSMSALIPSFQGNLATT